MKILNGSQIQAWDKYTIDHEPISSAELMERAANACVQWLDEEDLLAGSFIVFCGKGNNGGDGLAIARMLTQKDCKVSVCILEFGHRGTQDFQLNLERLHRHPGTEIRYIQGEEQFPSIDPHSIVIDALFGSGLNRPLEGITAKLVDHINGSGCTIISIDIPSGLPVDQSVKGDSIVKANFTLSFQVYKLSFLFQENARFIGQVRILDIGLHRGFYETVETDYEMIDPQIIASIYKPRDRFSHKGNFGHALIIAGSYGKMGAAVLCAKGCLRAGAGLTTSHIPKCGYDIMQTALPEVMVSSDVNSSFITTIATEELAKYSCIAVGPGLGTASETKKMLHQLFEGTRVTMVIDADGLNIIALEKSLLKKLPKNSILTPHPKEFERLFGKTASDFERLQLALKKAHELNVVIVVKSHHTAIVTPGGKVYFNNTGNAGMAKGGSGDALTGIIAGLVCQLKDTVEAAILGVYLHGLAADLAAEKFSEEAMVAGDIIENIGVAFLLTSRHTS